MTYDGDNRGTCSDDDDDDEVEDNDRDVALSLKLFTVCSRAILGTVAYPWLVFVTY